MQEPASLLLFASTFFFISLSPGLCMSLAMTLGMTIGVRRTCFMMVGELLGVAIVTLTSYFTLSQVIVEYPWFFQLIKWLGAFYLFFLGIKSFLSTEHGLNRENVKVFSPYALFTQGLVTAVSNPKGWAFMVAILPPFIDPSQGVYEQLAIFTSIILLSETIAMFIYATGGKGLKKLLVAKGWEAWINKIGGLLLVLVGIFLLFS